MAHTLDTSQANNGLTGNPTTYNYTCGSGATVLVVHLVVVGSTNRTGGAPTYNAQTMTQVNGVEKYTTSPETNVELWYLLNPPTGSAYAVSIPNSGSLTIHAFTSSAKAQTNYTSAIDGSTNSNGNGANPSLAVTNSVAGDFISCILGHGTGTTPSVSGNQSQYGGVWGVDHGAYCSFRMYNLSSGTGSTTFTWTAAADDWGYILASWKEVSITTLVVSDGAHAHTTDTLALTQQSTLTVSDGLHAHTTDALALTQQSTLAVSDGLHAVSNDEITLSSTGGDTTLTLSDGAHTVTNDGLTLTQAHALAVSDGAHAVSNDGLTLTQAHSLAVSDGAHSHTTDNVTLTQAHTLAVSDGAHAHTTDGIALTQAHTLAVSDGLHAHTTDNITLDSSSQLVVSDGAHAHTTDGITLSQAHVLAVSDGAHAVTNDTVTLVMPDVTLTVADGYHSTDSDPVTLVQGGPAAVYPCRITMEFLAYWDSEISARRKYLSAQAECSEYMTASVSTR